MCVTNDPDGFHPLMDVIDRVPGLGRAGACVEQELRGKLVEHREYIRTHGEDMPGIRDWHPSRGGRAAHGSR